MAVTTWTAGQVLAAADLNDTFASKLDATSLTVKQIVRSTVTSNNSTTSATFTDAPSFSVTITPQSNTSAVILIASCLVRTQITGGTAGSDLSLHLRITDNSGNAISGAEDCLFGQFGISRLAATTTNFLTPAVIKAYATPATTSAVTYKVQWKLGFGSVADLRHAVQTGQMYAIEVTT